MGRLADRYRLAISRPDILMRKLTGQNIIEIELREIEPYLLDSPVILEAGACDGTDTARFVQCWPSGTVYAFEPVPSLFADLKSRTENLLGVRCYQSALSDRTGLAELHLSGGERGEGGRDSSSLLAPALHLSEFPTVKFIDSIMVRTTTIADWAKRECVDHVDFMWLDMQGMELPALKNAGFILETTTAICMEVARKELYRGCATYNEIIEWMRSQGFHPIIDRVATSFGNILFVRRNKIGSFVLA
jgi:2-O-methyltransferase